ncbi:hypothetical protein CTV96_09455 [Bacillus altitudinis]|uniref:hypothetical protein n=1 Tax=Bacillus altitudinis TaxID=293387 RepID=UPI000C245FB9|nr:hypothetical protein [Bacillus altitudinis]PJI12364.1 hypothetical protein CTV96_09455 [Bacillus altitudinis]PKQ85622.1 hypothetical protein CTV98_007640 [Bacillus altitudinis]
MRLHRWLKTQTFKNYSGYDYTYDGMYPKPRVKGEDKKMRSKHERTLRKRIDRKEAAMNDE